MNTSLSKPRLVFFQYQYDPHLPAFLLTHKDEHARCLSQFFDVTVIRDDCDYQEVCDTYQPDVALFESGVPNPACRRISIANVRVNPHVMKLGFLHSDGFCCGRAGFLSDMDHWGIETFFAIATTAPEHLPAIADNLFIWPNFADPQVYRDYGQWKSIPALFTGNKSSMYPWRRKIIRTVSEQFPSMICPHPGYSRNSTAQQVPVGEAYARMLNASWFVLACGTVAKEVVRKHFEIPACNACLVTEASAALEAAGFADMENCVFADAGNIVDKLNHLFRNPETLNTIIANGHRLVQTAHIPSKRDQILQWFLLKKSLLPHQRIVQNGPFSDLSTAETSSGARNTPVLSNGDHLLLLQAGDDAMRVADYERAERLYLKSLSYISYMPEPKVRLALSYLHQGKARQALSWISQPLQFTLAEYGAADPDPVEWAFFIVTLLALGKIDAGCRRAREFPAMRHPQLDLARLTIALLSPANSTTPPLPLPSGTERHSLHRLPGTQYDQWFEQLSTILRACGQNGLADRIATRSRAHRSSSAMELRTPGQENSATRHPNLSGRNTPKDEGRSRAHRFFKTRLRYTNARATIRTSTRDALHRLEARYRYFLPYRLSTARQDEFFRSVEELAREEEITSALVLGASSHRGCVEALLTGANDNPCKPSVYRLDSASREAAFSRLGIRSVVRTRPEPRLTGLHKSELDAGIARLKTLHNISAFDLILINGSEFSSTVRFSSLVCDEMYSARFVLLDDINVMPNNHYHTNLLARPDFVLKDHNPDLRHGYSIFARDEVTSDALGPAEGWTN